MTIQSKSSLLVQLLVAVGTCAFVVLYCLQHTWTVNRAAGLIIVIAASLLWTMARIQLGRSFSIKAKATELVVRGVYSKIRNPIYVSGTFVFVGVILVVGRPIWLLILLVVVPMQVIRARKEAAVLEEKFGDAYREYRRKTWF